MPTKREIYWYMVLEVLIIMDPIGSIGSHKRFGKKISASKKITSALLYCSMSAHNLGERNFTILYPSKG